MQCLPVFTILLLLASTAAPNPLETRIQSDLTRADLEDSDTKTDERFITGLLGGLSAVGGITSLASRICCAITDSCC
uniref:G112 VD Superfamily T precursor conopeptide n=1 Tax=Conus geographus TaxID=6491 RepID=X5IY24_CONGE|nr:G112_VD_Superfamily_T_precursor_conopeptide [Conus geographus]